MAILVVVACVIGVILAAKFGDQQGSRHPGVPSVISAAITGSQVTAGNIDDRSIKAQEAVVTFSFWAVIVAAATTLITAAGTFFLIYQFRQTREAIRQAEVANKIAQDNHASSIRPYVTMEFGPEDSSEGRWVARFRNQGQSPAMLCEFDIECSIITAGEFSPIFKRSRRSFMLTSDELTLNFPEPRFVEAPSGTQLTCSIVAKYQSVDEKKYVTSALLHDHNDTWSVIGFEVK